MTSITAALIKATVGLPLNQSKGRKLSTEQIKDGDITDPKFLEMIVREIDKMVRQIRRQDLSMSLNCFREGVVHLFKLFYTAKTGENSSATSLAEGMERLKLTDLGDANKGALSNAKEAFNMACAKATEAFSSEHFWPVRIEAMVLRVAATILQRVDNLEAALTPCKLCLEEFHSIPHVKEKFKEICDNPKAGQRMRGSLEIISTVHQVNRLIYDVTQTVGKDAHIWIWPSVAVTQRLAGVFPIYGDNKVDPLRDVRVTKPLQDLGIQDCSVTLWSFGQEGDEDHKLLGPHSICTNRKGHFIVSDYRANDIKVFDKGGKFLKKFRTPSPTHVCDVVTDRNGNIYTLSYLLKREADEMEYTTELTLTVYYKETHLQRTSSHLPVKRNWCGFNELHSYLAVSDSNKVFLLSGIRGEKTRGGYRVNYLVDVYTTDGQFVCSFGEEKIKSASAIVTDNDARVMILEMSSVRVFSEQGDQIFGFSIDGPGPSEESKIGFHRESEYVVVVQKDRIKDILRVQIYAKNGKFEREIYLRGEKIHWVRGMTVTDDGHVAISYGDLRSPYGKVTVV